MSNWTNINDKLPPFGHEILMRGKYSVGGYFYQSATFNKEIHAEDCVFKAFDREGYKDWKVIK